jgi:phosphatidylserine/phosphatidylglycerophosphate/cardiolipin synthase-like enzyme
MPATLKVYANEDDALLFWRIPQPIPQCRGFAIERRITRNGSDQETTEFLHNRIGFEGERIPGPKEGRRPITKPSTEWPFQRFSWTDHDANTGDSVRYRIVPMVRTDGALTPLDTEASKWSSKRCLGVNKESKFQPYFNRGFVISQFMSRFLEENHLSLKAFKDRINDEMDKTIRHFLSGDLRVAVLEQLKIAFEEKTEIFAALFELSDDELVNAVCKLGKKAHVVLSNGSVQPKKGVPASERRKEDENKKARAKLEQAGVDVEVLNRFISPGALGHNKFLVRTDKKGKPAVAWTGSTNWAPTGLCTQVNNGLLINDPRIAKIYREQWQRLRDAGSEFPEALIASNSKPKAVGDDVTVWFSRTTKRVDLDALTEAVENAKEGVLFLMFMPGSSGLFSTVAKLSGNPHLYVRGVVSTLPNGVGDESAVDVNLIDGGKHRALHLDIIQPEGVKHPLAKFAEEVTRKQFLSQIGHAIIHSKVVVVDPFSDNPTVITGSHNFSTSASTKNDENFIIVQGDKELAEAYAVNVEGAYAHYRWRAFLDESDKPFNGLKDNDAWQAPRLAGMQTEFKFWGLGAATAADA